MVNLTAFLRAAQNLNQATKILQRTFEVKTIKKTRSLVKKWTKYEVSISVDIESHNNGKPGLITIKDFSKNIYFIRTGLDHNLTPELRDVFENSKVTKTQCQRYVVRTLLPGLELSMDSRKVVAARCELIKSN